MESIAHLDPHNLCGNFAKAKELLSKATNVVVFTGAGMSAESGISTFRDPDTGAFWGKVDPTIFATMDGFQENPDIVWEWYMGLFEKMTSVKPNRGHELVAELQKKFNVTIITQNIDNLHERARVGNEKIIHLHGPGGIRCTNCDLVMPTDHLCTIMDKDFDPKVCISCGHPTRPDVVWFGEDLPKEPWQEAVAAMYDCDVCIVIGTSGQVEPAASLPALARTIISINTRAEDHARLAFDAITLTGKASEILSTLTE